MEQTSGQRGVLGGLTGKEWVRKGVSDHEGVGNEGIDESREGKLSGLGGVLGGRVVGE